MISSQLDFLNDASLAVGDFNDDTCFIIKDFIAERLITLIYADGGNGKSWLGFAIAKHCALLSKQVIYLDFDNPLNVLKERCIDSLLVAQYQNLHYIQRSKSPQTPQELLEQLSASATANAYKGCVFIFDSLRNFTNINNDNVAMQSFTHIMNLREAGATVLILHHSNKDGKNYQGSNNIRNSVDNMYQLQKLPSEDAKLHLHLQVKKERCAITDKVFIIDTTTLSLDEDNINTALITDEQNAFIGSVVGVLFDGDLNKTELLKAVGRAKDDKTARKWLDDFEGVYWKSTKQAGVCTYTYIESCNNGSGCTTDTTAQ